MFGVRGRSLGTNTSFTDSMGQGHHRYLIVETNSLLAYKDITSQSIESGRHSNLIKECCKLLKHNWTVEGSMYCAR